MKSRNNRLRRRKRGGAGTQTAKDKRDSARENLRSIQMERTNPKSISRRMSLASTRKKLGRFPRRFRQITGRATESDEVSDLVEEFARRAKDADESGDREKGNDIAAAFNEWYGPIRKRIEAENEIVRRRNSARKSYLQEQEENERRSNFNRYHLKSPGSRGYQEQLGSVPRY
jgi:hypothetical protein